MSICINHNLMAMDTARNLSQSYNSLSTSVQRLSSGLRINSAADDAAGLAVREMMRTDVRVLDQGVRNANDAVSMIQTADGGLSVIDEKLTRMKELAEQAATGTYTTAQRAIMDSEYQAMASEITRIAEATNFNGIKLLNENLFIFHDGEVKDPHQAGIHIHFGTGNSSAEDYYYVNIAQPDQAWWLSSGLGMDADMANQSHRAWKGAEIYSYWYLGSDFATGAHHGDLVQQAVLTNVDDQRTAWIAAHSQAEWDALNVREQHRLEMGWAQDEIDTIKTTGDDTHNTISADGLSAAQGRILGQGADYYFGSFEGYTIYTQKDAQESLGAIDTAVLQKDQNRAQLGATANRLSNTINNLQIQAQSLQAAESQISDVDVATEMTQFTREQVLTQAGTAMLTQANAIPQVALKIINGGA